jgi:hypothetical protein
MNMPVRMVRAAKVACSTSAAGVHGCSLIYSALLYRLMRLLDGADTVRFRPFSFAEALPLTWTPPEGCDTLDACAMHAGCRTGINRALVTAEGTASICCLLPDLRC